MQAFRGAMLLSRPSIRLMKRYTSAATAALDMDTSLIVTNSCSKVGDFLSPYLPSCVLKLRY